MAQSVQIILEDDLDGGAADETVQFGLDGLQYEIDLSTANAEKLREALRPYAAAGRRAQNKATRTTGPRTSSGNSETAKIRAWAKENGYEVSDRGRIHRPVKDAYYAAQESSTPPSDSSRPSVRSVMACPVLTSHRLRHRRGTPRSRAGARGLTVLVRPQCRRDAPRPDWTALISLWPLTTDSAGGWPWLLRKGRRRRL
jgi:hypothetical protein